MPTAVESVLKANDAGETDARLNGFPLVNHGIDADPAIRLPAPVSSLPGTALDEGSAALAE